jgi:hypothetical protein
MTIRLETLSPLTGLAPVTVHVAAIAQDRHA